MASSNPVIVGGAFGPLNPVSAGYVSSAMFGSLLSPADTGIYSFPAQVGIGGVGSASIQLNVIGSVNASASSGFGARVGVTVVATANTSTLFGARIEPTFTPGAFTGLNAVGLRMAAFSTAAFTSPADPIQIDIQALTGTGAGNAYGIRIAPPTGATNNYLIAHTTPGTFNVLSSGAITSAGILTLTQPTANTGQVLASGGSLTGSNASTFWSYAGTWNTSGTPTAVLVNITDTASNANSLLFDFQTSSSSRLSLRKSGVIIGTDGTSGFRIDTTAAGGENITGTRFRGLASNGFTLAPDVNGSNGTILQAMYFDGSNYRVAWKVANTTGAANGTLSLVPTGGAVTVGTSTAVGLVNLVQGTANTAVLTSTGYSLTGSSAVGMVSYSGTWNTSGTPTAWSLSITNTASNASSLLMNLLAGAAGTTSMFSVSVGGAILTGGGVVAGAHVRAATGSDISWVSSTVLTSPADGQMNVRNNGDSAGVGFDFATDAVLKLRVRAQNAYATLDVLGVKASGVAGASGTSTPGTGTVTVVNGIVTALT